MYKENKKMYFRCDNCDTIMCLDFLFYFIFISTVFSGNFLYINYTS